MTRLQDEEKSRTWSRISIIRYCLFVCVHDLEICRQASNNNFQTITLVVSVGGTKCSSDTKI